MKNTLLAFVVAATAFSANGQNAVTLSASNMTMLKPGAINLHVVNPATLSNPATGTNQTWNYNATFGGPVHSVNFVAASAFSASAVMDTSALEQINSNFSLKVFNVYDMDTAGFYFAGAQVPKQDYTLGDLTGTYTDSIFIKAQTYKLRQNFIKYPAAYGKTWASNTSHTINFVLNAPSYFLNNTKGSKLTHTHVTDSIVGWGTMTIPSTDKGSIPYPVLMVKEHTMTVDSFFLNNAPAPQLLLSQLGTVQGEVSNGYTIDYYRAGSPVAFMTMNYDTDYTYTTPVSGSYTADNVESGINDYLPNNCAFNVFPNPNTSGIYNCTMNKATSGNWSLVTMNTLGQVVDRQTVSGTGNLSLTINLAGQNTNELYYVNITDENGNSVATGKLGLVK